jgi:hypothetical protein
MGSTSNVSQKLWQTIETLATGEGGIQERLESAALSLIGVYLPPEGDLPKKYREEFDSIKRDLTKGGEGTIHATIPIMNDQEAKQVVRRILSLYIQIKGGI